LFEKTRNRSNWIGLINSLIIPFMIGSARLSLLLVCFWLFFIVDQTGMRENLCPSLECQTWGRASSTRKSPGDSWSSCSVAILFFHIWPKKSAGICAVKNLVCNKILGFAHKLMINKQSSLPGSIAIALYTAKWFFESYHILLKISIKNKPKSMLLKTSKV
jgi:hypothetical protein